MHGDILLGRIAGIPFRLHWSLFVAVALITWSVTPIFFGHFEDRPPIYWGLGLACAAGLFVSVLLHELGHALAARGLGIPVRGIRLFVFGGVAEIGGEPRTPGEEVLVALAGPAVTLVLVMLFALLALVFGVQAGDLGPIEEGRLVAPVRVDSAAALAGFGLVIYLLLMNGVLLAFNLVPAFPLDGGRVLRAGLWAVLGSYGRGTRWAGALGLAFAILLMAWGGYNSLFRGDWAGLWSVLLGFFLLGAARSSINFARFAERLDQVRVHQLMQPPPPSIPGRITAVEAWEDYFARSAYGAFAVDIDGRYAGLLPRSAVEQALEEFRLGRCVAELLPLQESFPTLSPEHTGQQALMLMLERDRGGLAVVAGGQLVGVLTRGDLLDWLQARRGGAARETEASLPEVLPADEPEDPRT